jgi:hypothetical protein
MRKLSLYDKPVEIFNFIFLFPVMPGLLERFRLLNNPKISISRYLRVHLPSVRASPFKLSHVWRMCKSPCGILPAKQTPVLPLP